MAKVPLIPTWWQESWERFEGPNAPPQEPLTEEECIETAQAHADWWNGNWVDEEVYWRKIRNWMRRERRRKLKEEAEAAARRAAELGLPLPAPAPKPLRTTQAKPRRPKRKIEIGRPRLGLITPPPRSRRRGQTEEPFP